MHSASNELLTMILVLLVLGSGLFSAIETAYSSANRIKLKSLANDKRKGAEEVLQVLSQFDRFLSTVLIVNNILNIAAATLGTILFTRLYGPNGPTISTIVITVAVLMFGEIAPKNVAKHIPEQFALKTVGIVRFFQVVFAPLNVIFKWWQALVSKLIHFDEDDSDFQDELITMVDEAEKDGDLQQHESDLISAAIEFNDLEVKDVLTPRVEVLAVEIGASLKDVENAFRMNSFSRLPVYERSIDNIVGVIHEKDFYNMLYVDRENGQLRKIIKPVVYTNANVRISRLLKQLQGAKVHLAIVLDEYGGTEGIITMEDIIEELVGEIWDEHDTVREYYTQLNDTTWLVKCDADVDDMFERFNVEFDVDEYDFITVSGWVIHAMQHIPNIGESFDFENLHIIVTKADQRKVLEIKVVILPSEQDEEN